MKMQERDYWLGFSVFSGIGPTRFGKLLTWFGTAENAWHAQRADVQKSVGEIIGQQFDTFRKTFDIFEYKNSLEKQNVWFVHLADVTYPNLLKRIPNPPFVLYGKGEKKLLSETVTCLAVVGSRKTTQYGRDVTESLVKDLALSGMCIVSGLAMGVDAVAHKTALENGAHTIAVLGCGVDCCFPSVNQALYNSIIATGSVIVSEEPLSHPPSKGSFPSRNRIIAGLSVGVLVTEGAEDSGSLITAEYGFKFSRKVFAVPGPINAQLSKGPLKLIRKGAKMVSSAQEIIEDVGYKMKDSGSEKKTGSHIFGNATNEEREILELLVNESLHFDEIARRLKMDSSVVGTLLTMMEIKGMVKSLENGNYSCG